MLCHRRRSGHKRGTFAAYVPDGIPVLCLTKGIEAKTGASMYDILAEELGGQSRIVVLSGSNHVEEVSQGKVAATVVACADARTAGFFQDLMATDYFRVYTTDDVVGVEICAAAKNIYAIAAGMASDLEFGDNAFASLLARASAEMSRLVVAAGGGESTCLGLAGIGGLVATCSSAHSRNRALGVALTGGGTLEEFEERTHMAAEGAAACKPVTELALHLGVETSIVSKARDVLWEGVSAEDASVELMTRPLKGSRPATLWLMGM